MSGDPVEQTRDDLVSEIGQRVQEHDTILTEILERLEILNQNLQ